MRRQANRIQVVHPRGRVIYIKAKRVKKRIPKSEFLGLHKLFDRSYSPFAKFLWLIVVIGCVTGCICQITLRINIYLEGSIAYDVHYRPQTLFKFPSVTICDPKFLNLLTRIHYGRGSDEVINISKIWKENEINIEDMYASLLDCEGSITQCMQTDLLSTIVGSCVMLTIRDKMMYVGPNTMIQLTWQSNINNLMPLHFFVHDDNFRHKYDGILIAEEALMGCTTKFRIHAKEMIHINSYRNPCVPEKDAHDCLTKCIDKELLKMLTCNVPFLSSPSLQPCVKVKHYVENIDRMIPIYRNMSYYIDKCECKPKCQEMKYTLYKDDERRKVNINYTDLILIYADDTHQTITEREVFSASALFSDIGGTIGLYLGISICAIFDFVEYLIRRFFVNA